MKYLTTILNMLIAPFSYRAFKNSIKTSSMYEIMTALLALLHFSIAGLALMAVTSHLPSLVYIAGVVQIIYGFIVVALLMKHMVRKVITEPDKPIYYYSQDALENADNTAATIVLNKEFAFVLSRLEIELLHKVSAKVLYGNELDPLEETEI